jgi:hypothetical protein
MREAELRQKGITDQNWKYFMAGAIGFLIVVLLAFFITQYIVKDEGFYRGQEYPVGQTSAPMDTNPQAFPHQEPGTSQGETGSDGAYFFFSPRKIEAEHPVYFSITFGLIVA